MSFWKKVFRQHELQRWQLPDAKERSDPGLVGGQHLAAFVPFPWRLGR